MNRNYNICNDERWIEMMKWSESKAAFNVEIHWKSTGNLEICPVGWIPRVQAQRVHRAVHRGDQWSEGLPYLRAFQAMDCPSVNKSMAGLAETTVIPVIPVVPVISC